jgi:hypothetical protein
MLTNIRESKGRLIKEAEISTYAGRYYLNTPGQGLDVPYLEDPHFRLQHYSGVIGASNTVNWESDLRGLTRPLMKGDTQAYDNSQTLQLPVMAPIRSYTEMLTDESRSTLPAWTFRELEQDRWEKPFLNPLDKCFMPFETEMNIRRKETDAFVAPKDVTWENMAPLVGQAFTFQPIREGVSYRR